MSDEYEEFRPALPGKALHPVRESIVEAIRWIGEPLSARETADVLDGRPGMWDVAHHLRILEAFGVVEPSPAETSQGATERDAFDVPYQLTEWWPDAGR